MKTNLLKFIFILIFLGGADLLFSQQKIRDSVVAIAHEYFIVPEFPEIALNLMEIDIAAELFNDKMEKIRDIKNITQKPSKEDLKKITQKTNRGTTVSYRMIDMIEEKGVYFIKTTVKYRDEKNNRGSYSDLYKVIINYPTFASLNKIDPTYYYGEKGTFSFATREYSDYQKYSYRIKLENGTVVDSGSGPIINFDRFFMNPANVGKKYIIEGLYGGKTFKFIDPKTNDIIESIWNFFLSKPQGISEINAWATEADWEKAKVWYIGIDNSFSSMFQFMYTSQKGNNYITVTPDARNLSVTCDPPQLLKDYSARPSGGWLFIEMNFNKEWVKTLKNDTDVTITISFQTQFERIVRTYRATIF
jgi:hypothetical protein